MSTPGETGMAAVARQAKHGGQGAEPDSEGRGSWPKTPFGQGIAACLLAALATWPHVLILLPGRKPARPRG